MAILESGIYSKLSGTAGVTALVSTRIYPMVAPQEVTPPFVTFQRISTLPNTSHDGPNHMTRCRVQFDCYATTLLAAKGVANAVRAAIDGEKSALGSVTVNACWRMDEQDLYDGGTGYYRVSSDYAIVFQDS